MRMLTSFFLMLVFVGTSLAVELGPRSGETMTAAKDRVSLDTPCILECNGGTPENEPALEPGYIDLFNCGCSAESGTPLFRELFPAGQGTLDFCGMSGWPEGPDAGTRDTDWFMFVVGDEGIVTWTMDAEQETYGLLLAPGDCEDVEVLDAFIAGPCNPGELTFQGEPWDYAWIWVGPASFQAPDGFEGYAFDYTMHLDGLIWGLPTEARTLGAVKSLYR